MARIPRIIHQIWFQGEKHLPEKYLCFSDTWKAQTEFLYMFWDQNEIERLLYRFFPRWIAIYHSYPTMIQKIDLAKYMILFYYGGVYIDMDVFRVSDLGSFLNSQSQKSFIVFEHNAPYLTVSINKMMGLSGNRIINNAVIFSSPRHFRLKTLLDSCHFAQQHNWTKNVLSLQLRCLVTTGPIIFTNSIRTTEDWQSCVLHHSYFEPYTTLDMLHMSNIFSNGSGKTDHVKMMEWICEQNVGNSIGVHALDLSWFKNGKDNWKFRAFQSMQNIPHLSSSKTYIKGDGAIST
jgi:mannosyltransferase OCH1-like enzyme